MSRRTYGRAAALSLTAGAPSPAWSQWLAAEAPLSNGGLQDLHLLALWACAAVVAIVYCAMIRAIVKAPGRGAYAGGHGTAAEVMWTLAAAAILVATAVPSTWGLIRHDGTTAVTVQATGHGWRWHYAYPEHGVDFFSSPAAAPDAARGAQASAPAGALGVDEPLVVPVNAQVRLLLTSTGEVHPWWIPELGIKADAVPGTVGVTGFFAAREGVYHGRCEEPLPGCMSIVVKVTGLDEYLRWLDGRRGDLLSRLD